jgi:hypothetical protein
MNLNIGDIENHLNAAAGSSQNIYIGYNKSSTGHHNIKVQAGHIQQITNASALTKSEIILGARLQESSETSTTDITVGNIKSELSASIGWNNGVYVGVCNNSSCGNITHTSGDITARSEACMDGFGCWSDIAGWGDSSCIVMASNGVDDKCGNTDVIDEAWQLLLDAGYYINEAGEWVEDTAADIGDDISNAASDAGSAIGKAFGF